MLSEAIQSNSVRSSHQAASMDATTAAAAAAAGLAGRDDSAVNREIAALLLNLHASASSSTDASTSSGGGSVTAPKAEDLTVRASIAADTAMDLSKAKTATALAALGNPQISKQMSKAASASSLDLSKNGAELAAAAAAASNYGMSGTPTSAAASNLFSSYYPSVGNMAGLSPSTLSALNSNYLLQNLLLGKIHQLASAVTTASINTPSIASLSNALSFPTQPLPAQSLHSSSPGKPASTSKGNNTATTNTTSSAAAAAMAAALSASTNGTQQSAAMLATGAGNATANIPLLCGQIVAQLNGLLFLVHNLNNAQVELSLQTQLSAIYTRLQEVVVMVEQAKKDQDDKEHEEKKLQKQLERMKENKAKEEETIAKHIQEYQRAVLKQVEVSTSAQITPLKETTASNTVANMIKKAYAESDDGQQEAESTTAAKRRRGRPPKNSNMDLTYSPPEKRLRESVDGHSDGGMNGVESTTLGLTNGLDLDAAAHAAIVPKSGGGGKGIRNRVFCGECSGCLKNDDCGRCRYCQDKTKFGGQNRLRQKCLYRRCQMDTNRKRPGGGLADGGSAAAAAVAAAGLTAAQLASVTPEALAAAVSAAAASCSFNDPPTSRHSPSPNAIYSGLDLARLAATAAAAEKLAVSSSTNDDVVNGERIRK